MQSIHRLFTPIFPTVSYRFMALLPLDVNDIFENVIVNIKNTAFYIFYSSFTVTVFLYRVLHVVFPKACVRFSYLKMYFYVPQKFQNGK